MMTFAIYLFQQIEEDHAKKVCHKYRSKVLKMNKKREEDQQKYLADKIEELHNPVAKSAKGLCRKILRYKGESEKKMLFDKNYSHSSKSRHVLKPNASIYFFYIINSFLSEFILHFCCVYF